MRIVILGAGFGGLELSTRLSEEFGDGVDVVLIDKGEGFVFGFSKLDVMFGFTDAEHVLHRFEDAVKPGVHPLNFMAGLLAMPGITLTQSGLSGSAFAETGINGKQQNANRRVPPGGNPGCGRSRKSG